MIDGNALLHRAFHAVPAHFSTSKGEQTNAIYGFANVFINILNELQPDMMAVAFDRKAPTFRHEEFEDYKATRVKAPDELYAQIPRIKEVVESFNVPIYELDGYEADDVIGTLADKACREGKEVIVVTGDLDALQLVNGHIKVCTYRKGFQETILYDRAKVKERYGLSPEQIVDFKAIAGDSSDNIPGVAGIGKVGATKLLQAYGTLEKIYLALDDGSFIGFSEGIKKKLLDNREQAFLSRHLATIVRDVPFEFDFADMKVDNLDLGKVAELFQELEFVSLLRKLGSDEAQETETIKIEEDPQVEQGTLF